MSRELERMVSGVQYGVPDYGVFLGQSFEFRTYIILDIILSQPIRNHATSNLPALPAQRSRL